MIPVITIIGRPNVGKSTLFNLLTQSRDALVADMPGVTRDRQYGQGQLGERSYLVVDTGGLAELNDPTLAELTDAQVDQAIKEATILLFMVDAKSGLTTADQSIADRLRQFVDKVVVVVNKVDSEDKDIAISEFHQLGLGEPRAISAIRKRGVKTLITELLSEFPPEKTEEKLPETGIRVAVVGRPNVGKSTLINRILGEERVVVLDQPGTTRDSIYIPFLRRDKNYTLIDTAGIRRRTKVKEAIEKFSIIKTLQAMQEADVVVTVLDASEGVTEQDQRLLGMVIKMGKGLVMAINKWDGLSDYEKEQVKQTMDLRLSFVDFARRYFISALHGSGVGKLYPAIEEAYESSIKKITTSDLTNALAKAIENHPPPLVHGRRIRLRYAHIGGHHPLLIIIHGKQVKSLPNSYRRYLSNYFRETFRLVGVPIILKFKSDVNPYKK